MPSPLLERVKIQAEVLVPLLKALREEFGAERVNQVAWRVLADLRTQIVRERYAPFSGTPVERWAAGTMASQPEIGDAVGFEMLNLTPGAFNFNVTGCRFAQFFRDLGEPELGFALLCAMDDTAAEEIGAGDVHLTRTGTIMQGAGQCDFRYALKTADPSNPAK